MRDCLAPLGGMGASCGPDRGPSEAQSPRSLCSRKAVTTHPAIVRAAILLAQEAGGTVFIGDSPGVGSLAYVAKACGLTPVLEETGAELADFSTSREFDGPHNTVAKRLTLAKAVADADVIVTLPKLKTTGR